VQDSIKLIKQIGAKLYIFEHTKSEVINLLSNYIKRQNNYVTDIPVNSIYYALKNQGYDINKVKTLISNIDKILQRNNINIRYAKESDNKFKQDNFVEFISKKIELNKNNFSIENDCQSITLIQQLRKNQFYQFIGKSKYLFLTSDNVLVYYSQKTHKQNSTIPEVFHHQQLAMQFWLSSVNGAQDSHIHNLLSKEVMGKVIESDLWDQFINKLDESIRAKDITPEDADELMADKNTQSILLNEIDPIPKIINPQNIQKIKSRKSQQNEVILQLKEQLQFSQENEALAIQEQNKTSEKIQENAKKEVDKCLKIIQPSILCLLIIIVVLCCFGLHTALNSYYMVIIFGEAFANFLKSADIISAIPFSLLFIKTKIYNFIEKGRDQKILKLIKKKKSELDMN